MNKHLKGYFAYDTKVIHPKQTVRIISLVDNKIIETEVEPMSKEKVTGYTKLKVVLKVLLNKLRRFKK